MITAIDSSVPWVALGTVVVFLIVCVWHNRRVGYQRVRTEKIGIGEALALIKRSLSVGDEVLSVAAPQSEASMGNSTAGQLVRLNSALEQDGPPVSVEAPVEQPA